MLTGQEGPFLTIEQALQGPGRFYLLNGWNGLVTHPGVFTPLLAREDFDGYIIDVLVSESGQTMAKRLGDDRSSPSRFAIVWPLSLTSTSMM